MQFFGDARRFEFGLRAVVKRRVVAEHAEGVTFGRFFFDTISGRFGNRIRFKPPDKNADAGTVAASLRPTGRCAAQINGAPRFIKRAVTQIQFVAAAQIYRPPAPRSLTLSGSRPASPS